MARKSHSKKKNEFVVETNSWCIFSTSVRRHLLSDRILYVPCYPVANVFTLVLGQPSRQSTLLTRVSMLFTFMTCITIHDRNTVLWLILGEKGQPWLIHLFNRPQVSPCSHEARSLRFFLFYVSCDFSILIIKHVLCFQKESSTTLTFRKRSY